MKQLTEFTFEIEETIVLRRGEMVRQGYCPVCSEPTVMVAPQILAVIGETSEREIFRLIEAGKLYFTEDERIFACLICHGRTNQGETGKAMKKHVQVLCESVQTNSL
jgi:hypothetical protein